MPSPLIYDPLVGTQTARPILASDTAFSSGVIQSGMLGLEAVQPGNIGPLAVQSGDIAAASVNSGEIGPGAVISGTIGPEAVLSGNIGFTAVTSGNIDFNAVTSGNIASGAIGHFHIGNAEVQSGNIQSGAIGHFHIGNAEVLSGNIGSGQIGSVHLASGVAVSIAEVLTEDSFLTEEPISGGKAVCFSPSGNLRIAMAGVSGRMPAIGFLTTDIASGLAATFNHEGRVTTPFNFSGHIGDAVFVGVSGTIDSLPPIASGQAQQRIGVAFSEAGGLFLKPEIETVIV